MVLSPIWTAMEYEINARCQIASINVGGVPCGKGGHHRKVTPHYRLRSHRHQIRPATAPQKTNVMLPGSGMLATRNPM
jgi:hypothetical protein